MSLVPGRSDFTREDVDRLVRWFRQARRWQLVALGAVLGSIATTLVAVQVYRLKLPDRSDCAPAVLVPPGVPTPAVVRPGTEIYVEAIPRRNFSDLDPGSIRLVDLRRSDRQWWMEAATDGWLPEADSCDPDRVRWRMGRVRGPDVTASVEVTYDAPPDWDSGSRLAIVVPTD